MVDEYGFTFDGQHSGDQGISFREPIFLSGATPRVESTEIPGRNGDLHTWDGGYYNRSAECDCYVLSESIADDISAINSWLLSSQSYRRLMFDHDDRHFLMARTERGIEMQARGNLLTTCRISFDCKPQRYLVSGEEERDVSETLQISNPTAFPSSPLIYIEGQGNAAISYGNGFLSVVDMSSPIWYDTETDKAYNGNESMDRFVYASGDLSLFPGTNTIQKLDNYNGSNGEYDVDVSVGDQISVSYTDIGIANSPSAVYIKGGGKIEWYDDGGELVFTAKAPGVGTIEIWDSDSLVAQYSYRINASGTITKIVIVPRWWEL